MSDAIPATDAVGAFIEGPALLAAGAATGPLVVVRVAVKDVIDVAGSVTGAGNPDFAAGRPPAPVHAAAVQRLLDAGGSVVGRTVSDELAYSLVGRNVHHGAPANAAAPGHLCGGSSSGSAAAVAAGLADLGLGTDTGGSIRVPASQCGLFGWRPTHGVVDTAGVVPLAPSFDTVGLLAADPEVLRRGAVALLGATATPIAGSGGSAPPFRPVLWGDALDAVDDAVSRAVVNALDAMAGLEGQPPLRSWSLDLAAAAEAFRILQAREAWAAHGRWITEVGPTMGADVAERFAVAAAVTDEEVAAAAAARDRWRATLHDVVDGGTVLVLPAAAGPPPPVDAAPADLAEVRVRTMALTAPVGLAGLPAVVVPGGRLDGLPLGVALVGARGSDLALLDLAARLVGP